jgi:hypothetical protein
MLNAVNRVCLLSLMNPHVMLVEYEMYSRLFFSILWKNPGWVPDCQRLEQTDLWSTSQLSLWSGVFTWRPELSFRCLLSKVISFILSTLYIKHYHLIIPLFVAICEIWLPGLTYGVYLILFLKPGVTLPPCLVHAPSHARTRAAPAPARPGRNGLWIRFPGARLRVARCMCWAKPMAERRHPNDASLHMWSLAGLHHGNQTRP